jgi:signal transduction histidine kinase/ActR/RegA family two-component response regulator
MFVVNLINKAAESEELREAKIIAEHSNAAKSDFLANMSHEIRTPINAVLGMNEMILRESVRSRDELSEDRQEITDTFADICNNAWNIDSEGKSLLSLINDILDFSKIEAGKLELVDGDYKLSSVINDVCNMISFKAEAKKLKFSVNVNEEIPDSLYGDEIRVRQVMTNLLNNAVKYTHKGSVSFNVDFKKHEDEELIDLIVNVKDTGVGIKEEDVDKLFTKFERVDLEKNSTIEGTGLGLAITKSLVEMMDGEIKVESVYGEGSTFKFLIPQKYTSAEPIGDFRDRFKKTVSALTARKESIYAPEAKILVVDDTAMNLMVVKGLLRNSKINIDTAESGRDAIELAKESKYDIIFMDQRMPVMDGVTAMRIIKEESDTNLDTPIICLTADAISGAKDKYIAEGFTDYLSKPISVQELEQMLFDYLPEDKIKNKE